ncbi:DNA damage-inducible protein DinB [Aureimonas endophytica]|uniref:DNA damage-inducible protein DinB n=1 Tax=Aureimonas endophytica TaxID=2027858 RepID=A0A916ZNL7_9HYPH|nr:DinB family protein [Aureimonas endophytica]GGE06533.1 DNA damage-inducible protein DinB [Aureimonas endophytica]
MSAFIPLFFYQSWANEEFLACLERLDPVRQGRERHQALRLMNHIHVVSEIFAAHLEARSHGYAADNTDATPEPADLRAALAARDRWYCDYASRVSAEALAEPVAFTFTDGDRGSMTRAEMLTHVVLHGAYHRGEVGRLLAPLDLAARPWDTFAVFLHRTEPLRRDDGLRLLVPA